MPINTQGGPTSAAHSPAALLQGDVGAEAQPCPSWDTASRMEGALHTVMLNQRSPRPPESRLPLKWAQRAKCARLGGQTSRAWEGDGARDGLLCGVCLGQLGEPGSFLGLLRPLLPPLKNGSRTRQWALSGLGQTVTQLGLHAALTVSDTSPTRHPHSSMGEGVDAAPCPPNPASAHGEHGKQALFFRTHRDMSDQNRPWAASSFPGG